MHKTPEYYYDDEKGHIQIFTQWCVHKDGIVELGGGLRNVDRLHLFKAAQRVTLGHQLRNGPLVQSARDQQDDVIDHIAVAKAQRKEGRDRHKCSTLLYFIEQRCYFTD